MRLLIAHAPSLNFASSKFRLRQNWVSGLSYADFANPILAQPACSNGATVSTMEANCCHQQPACRPDKRGPSRTTHRLPTQLPEGKLHREPAQAPVPANKTQFSHISFLTKTHRHVGQRKRCPHLPKKTGAFLPGIESWARRILVTSVVS